MSGFHMIATIAAQIVAVAATAGKKKRRAIAAKTKIWRSSII